jgi:hypothetical protein
VVPDVAITITNVGTGVSNNVTSNSSGVYNVPLLDPAIYKVSAEKEGFKKYSQTGITLNVGQTVRVDFSLSLGSKTETVEVVATALQVERETSDNGTTITAREEQDLPLTSFGDQRSPTNFMQLAPGVTGEGNNSGGMGGNRTYTTAVSGSMVSSTTLMLDGADVTSEGGFEGDLNAFKVPPDAISEFKMETSNASAEYGRSAGGTASFQVKSGTNKIHGTAYEYLRNDALNARNFFQPDVSKYKHNEFGANAGGAIIKDKAFVFGYYDGFRLTQGVATGLATIPTTQMDQGNFTNYGYYDKNNNWVMQPVIDPISRTTCGTLVCNNIINPTNFDPVSAKVLAIPSYPHPTNPDPRAVLNNYTRSIANPLRVDEWGIKGDYVFNDKSRIALTYLTGKAQTPNVPLIPAPFGGGDQPSIAETRNVRLNWSLNARPNVINQATALLNQYNNGQQQISSFAGNSDWVGYLGIKGVTPNYKTQFPQIVINQQSWNGGGGAGLDNQHSSGFNDTLTWIKGKHSVKFGASYLRGADNNISTGNSAGYFNFLNDETAIPGQQTVTGIAMASFLLGRADEGRTYVFRAPAYSRTTYAGIFAQDDFKFSKKLTLNLGVRWDLFKPVVHVNNTKDWVNPALDNPALSPNNIPGVFQLASNTNPSGMNTQWHNFSPRVGLAYSLNEKTVIRAAYGIYYAQGNGDRVDGGSTVMGFNQTISSGTSPDGGITPGFIWGSQTLPAFVPQGFGPNSQLGLGVNRHSAGTLISVDPSDGMAPYAQNYTLSVQRQLPASMVLSVAFVGNEGTHTASRLTPWDKLPERYLPNGPINMCYPNGGSAVNATPCPAVFDTTTITSISALSTPIANAYIQSLPDIQAQPIDPNTGNHSAFTGFEALYGGPGVLPAGAQVSPNAKPIMGQSLLINPQYAGLHRYYEALGVSNYDALQVKLDKRFSNGLTLLVSYAWSKTLTDGGSIFSTFSSEFYTTTPWNRHDQKSYSYEDIPSNLSIAYVYDLPFGKGKKFLSQGGVVNAVIGGWKTSGVLRYQSGLPMNIEAGDTFQVWEDHGWQDANTITGIPQASAAKLSGHFDPRYAGGVPDSMFNPAAFAQPAAWTYGTQTPTEATVRGFPWPNEDISLMKAWKIKEVVDVQFNADFFNIFNRHVFGENNGAYANEPGLGSGFGNIGGQINNPRTVQFGLRLKW